MERWEGGTEEEEKVECACVSEYLLRRDNLDEMLRQAV